MAGTEDLAQMLALVGRRREIPPAAEESGKVPVPPSWASASFLREHHGYPPEFREAKRGLEVE